MNDARAVALGCMRLSTDPDRDDDRSVDVLHAAFDAGVTLLDTADAYCHDDRAIGHKEHRLDPAHCIYVGNGAADPGFARKLGFRYRRHE